MCVLLECTLVVEENEKYLHGKTFLDSCKTFTFQIPESDFCKENMYHYSRFKQYFQ